VFIVTNNQPKDELTHIGIYYKVDLAFVSVNLTLCNLVVKYIFE